MIADMQQIKRFNLFIEQLQANFTFINPTTKCVVGSKMHNNLFFLLLVLCQIKLNQIYDLPSCSLGAIIANSALRVIGEKAEGTKDLDLALPLQNFCH
jgi:hypothetical protein